MKSRRNSVRVAIVLAVVLALVLTAEIVFGRWIGDDPLDRLDLARNTAVTVSVQGGETFTHTRDSWGFRGTAIDPASVTILTIGGSATAQGSLPLDRTWQAVLGRELSAMGREAVIANAGIDGMSTAGLVTALESWFPNVPGLKPRFVLAHVGQAEALGPNDRVDSLEYTSLWRKSALSRLWPTLAPKGGKAIEMPAKPEVGPYKDRLKRIADLIHGNGAVPVLVTQPGSNPADGKALAAFNGATLDVCADLGLLCLDLAGEVTFGDGDFHDRVNLTPQGADKVGRWLAMKLAGLV